VMLDADMRELHDIERMRRPEPFRVMPNERCNVSGWFMKTQPACMT
jgi:hypothetical protein